LVLIISQTERETVTVTERNRNIEDCAEVLLGMIKEVLRRLGNERDPDCDSVSQV
jgi:hypothetical protein